MNVDVPDRRWWLAAVVAQSGDALTTAYGLFVLGLIEQNPIMQAIFDLVGTIPGLVTVKILLFTVSVGFYHLVSESKWAIPAILMVVGGLTTTFNLIRIVSFV